MIGFVFEVGIDVGRLWVAEVVGTHRDWGGGSSWLVQMEKREVWRRRFAG